MSAAVFRCAACGSLNRVPEHRLADRPRCGRCKNELDSDAPPQEVDGAVLASLVATSPVPVLVDFWAPWCGPCRMAAPIVEAVAKSRAGQWLVVKLNTDDQPEAGQRYNIMSIPTFAVFRNGVEVQRRSGISGKAELEAWLDRAASAGG